MSYILEALQKSEHARHRGKVPDLNTVPETTPSVTGHAATPRPPYLAAGFALALAAAILGWWRPWQVAAPHPAAPAPVAKAAETPQQTAGAQPMPQPAPPPQARQDVPAGPSQSTTVPTALAEPAAPLAVAPQPAPLAAAVPASQPALAPLAPVRPPAAAPEPTKTAAPVSRTRSEPPAPEIQTQAAEGTPVRRSESGSRKSAESAPPSPSPAPAARIATASPAAPAPAANRKGSAGRILSIHELPPAVRGSLPRLEISGFAAAPDSGKRMVVINDRLVQEGEEVVPGVTLTSAEKDGVVLDFQGYRFRAQQ